MGRRYEPLAWLRKKQDQERKDAEAYDRVQKLMEEGCTKISAAVREAAIALKRGERSVWTSIKRHPQSVESHEKINAAHERDMRIALGEEQPTDEETKEAGERYIQWCIDYKRGK